jgi:phosphonate transport system substrate-binding protein
MERQEAQKERFMIWTHPSKVILIFIIFGSFATVCPGYSAGEILKLGVVPQFSARHLRTVWEPIAQTVGRQANVKIKIIGSHSIPVFEQQFMAGVFDIVYLNPYHMVKAHQFQGYQPILRDIKQSLQGIVVARKDSPIQKVQELNGKVSAFPAPNALGASLIPRAEFDRTFNISFTPWYVKSHSSVYLNVLLSRAAAGGGVQTTLIQQPAHVREALRVIYRTAMIPSHPIAVHPRMRPEIRDRIQKAFLTISKTSIGKILLSNVPIESLGLASIKDYQYLKMMNLKRYYIEE